MRFVLALLLLLFAWRANASGLLVTARPISVQILFHGDSITGGFGTSIPYPARVETNIYAHITPLICKAYNRGINGQGFNYVYTAGISNLVGDAVVAIDPARLPYIPNYLVIFAGTNDIWLGGSTAAQTYSYFTNYISARLSAGWLPSQIFVCTMLPRETLDESIRTAYNTALVNGATTYGYGLVRLDLNAQIGAAGQQNDLTYYQAGAVHPNDAGAAIIAQLVYAAIFP